MGKLLLSSILIICAFIGTAQKPVKAGYGDEVMPGQFVVKFKQGESASITNLRNQKFNFAIKETKPVFALKTKATKSGLDLSAYYHLKTENKVDYKEVLKSINNLDYVEYIEPILIRRTDYVPDDPNIASQGFLEVIKAYEAWDITQGSEDIVVAIIDSGVDYEHDDLKDKIYLNEGEIPDNDLDDDEDGYVDNYYGWDFAGADFENVIEDSDPIAKESTIDHGTRVAGCSSAGTDNGVGVAGVGFNSKYMALKCSAENDTRDNGSAFLLNTIFAVLYAADHGADIINMSYGGSGFSQFEQDVFTYAALEKDVVLVSSAGNGGTDLIQFPGGYDHVLSVAATNLDDTKAGFSEFGDWVDIAAPGVAVQTTLINNQYGPTSGTSFSAPIVAGAAALLRSHYPDYNQFQITQLLIQSAEDVSKINANFEIGGRLDIERALTISTPAIRVSDFSIVNGSGETPKAGEEASVDISLVNELEASSSATLLEIEETSGSGIQFNETLPIPIGEISEGEINLNSVLTFKVPETLAFNYVLSLNVTIADSVTGFREGYNISAVLNSIKTDNASTPYLLADGGDFESGGGGFASGQISGGIDVWELGVPENTLVEVNSGTNAWKTDLDDDLPKQTYSCVLQSPVFNFSDDSKEYIVSFYKSMESEFCNAPSAVQLQYTTDGGVTWSRLGSRDDIQGTNWYNKDLTSACQIDPSILPDQEGWLGNFTNEYTAYNASFLAGTEEVIFRFLLSVSGNFESDINDDGFMVDDFQVEVISPRANFYTEETITYANRAVNFQFLSAGAVSYLWDFGDGNTSSLENPSHVYTNPGLYDVSLSIETKDGVTVDSVFENYINVLAITQVPYELSDGGDFETNLDFFAPDNVAGTPFELGSSSVSGKDGTASGSNAWVTGLDEDQYQDDSEAYLYTPEFTINGGLGEYILSFDAKYSFEPQWDGFIVEYTTNSGLSWIKLNDVVEDGWYDDVSVENAIWGTGIPIFTGSTGGNFVTKSTDISSIANNFGKVGFRFVFLTDAATVDVGLALDNFQLSGPVPGPALPNFSASVTSSCTDETIVFQNETTGSISDIFWDFGTGASPETATGIGPHEVVYSTPGSYTVSLTVEGIENGTQKETKEQYVTIGATHTPTISVEEGAEGVILTSSVADTYQWFLDGDTLQGETSQTLAVSDDGAYQVKASIDGCIGASAMEEVKLITGIHELNAKGINIFPNPVKNGYLNIVLQNPVSCEILNMSGKTIQEIKLERSRRIDLRNLPEGVYLLRFNASGERLTQKIVIEK